MLVKRNKYEQIILTLFLKWNKNGKFIVNEKGKDLIFVDTIKFRFSSSRSKSFINKWPLFQFE